MGYPSILGFRAGTSFPFHWFDIHKNQVTLLEIHPFCAMDVTLKNYLKYNELEAIEALKKLFITVDRVGGNCLMIWHNESVSDHYDWKGWRRVFEATLHFNNKTGITDNRNM